MPQDSERHVLFGPRSGLDPADVIDFPEPDMDQRVTPLFLDGPLAGRQDVDVTGRAVFEGTFTTPGPDPVTYRLWITGWNFRTIVVGSTGSQHPPVGVMFRALFTDAAQKATVKWPGDVPPEYR